MPVANSEHTAILIYIIALKAINNFTATCIYSGCSERDIIQNRDPEFAQIIRFKYGYFDSFFYQTDRIDGVTGQLELLPMAFVFIWSL